jgi:hypothetical protein
MRHRVVPVRTIVAVQAACLALAAIAAAVWIVRGEVSGAARADDPFAWVPVARRTAHRIEPLYNDPQVVNDDELAAVLDRIVPEFAGDDMQPNYLEHALRAWGVEATFQEPGVLSGAEMRDFLLDHRQQREFLGDSPPLLVDGPWGVGVRWEQPFDPRASAHHDHLLASLSEAGVTLDQPVFPPSGYRATFNTVFQQALYDFRLDELETDWSALSFALWLPPEVTRFRSGDGRMLTFDLLARRLMRGHKNLGVCSGTHRVYTLVVLWRLNEELDGAMLSDAAREEVWEYLVRVRDLITASQFADGHWPANWADGARAVEDPANDAEHERVIATGHHLEWLAIAPLELHPPREQIRKAADWIIATTVAKSREQVRQTYTFYSHVGNALAMWRGTHPAAFWRERTGMPNQPDVPATAAPGELDVPSPAPDGGLVPPPPGR